MPNIIDKIKEKLFGINTEFERTEPVEHDIVMIRVGDRMVEVTEDDSEER